MRIFSVTPMKNEADRYLTSFLKHLQPLVDEMFIYDDGSTDGSYEIASSVSKATVCVRMPDEASFLEHEGKFRYQCWRWFETACRPEPGDWVLAIDTDEILHCDGSEPGDFHRTAFQLHGCCELATGQAVVLDVPEVFGISEDGPLVRTDGLWGTIRGTRLFPYQPGGTWNMKAMGCGSEPTYVQGLPRIAGGPLKLWHFGYAHPDDVLAKFKRYSSLEHGHNNAHVMSIIDPPTLVPAPAGTPVLLRGA